MYSTNLMISIMLLRVEGRPMQERGEVCFLGKVCFQ